MVIDRAGSVALAQPDLSYREFFNVEEHLLNAGRKYSPHPILTAKQQPENHYKSGGSEVKEG